MAEFGKIIVVGGGIGGCTAALALHRAGCEVEIYEAAPEFKEIGAGINITSAAAGILISLGLEDTLRNPEIGDGIESSVRHYYSPEGILLAEEPLGLAAGETAPQFSLHRAKLHNALIDACRSRLGAHRMHLDHVFTHLEQDDAGVTAHFQRLLPPNEAHPPVRGAFLIGCDGLKSPVRAQLYGEVEPRYTGWTIYRGLVELPFEVCDGKTIVLCGGGDATFIMYPVSEGMRKRGKIHCNWAFAMTQPGPEKGENWTNQSSVEDIRPRIKDFAVKLGPLTPLEVAERTEGIIGWALFDRDPIARWAFGRVALLGDSAHPLLPFGSQGGTQATLDAQALGDAFAWAAAARQGGAEALKRYERVRAAPAAKVVLANRAMGPTKVLRVAEEECAGMPVEQKRGWVSRNLAMLNDLVQGYRKDVMNAHKQASKL